VPIVYFQDERHESPPSSPTSSSTTPTTSITHEDFSDEPISERRSTKVKKSNTKYPVDKYILSQFALTVSDPLYYEEATEKEVCQKAMVVEEMESIENNGTWQMVNLLEGKNAIDLK